MYITTVLCKRSILTYVSNTKLFDYWVIAASNVHHSEIQNKHFSFKATSCTPQLKNPTVGFFMRQPGNNVKDVFENANYNSLWGIPKESRVLCKVCRFDC